MVVNDHGRQVGEQRVDEDGQVVENVTFDSKPTTRAGFTEHEAQHITVDFWNQTGDFLLLHLSANLVFGPDYGVQKARLPRSWLRELNAGEPPRLIFDFGFPGGADTAECRVTGWSDQNEPQRQVRIEVAECPPTEEIAEEHAEDAVCVRKVEVVPRGFWSRVRNWVDKKIHQHLPSHWFFNLFRNNKNVGSLLTCTQQNPSDFNLHNLPLLMGVGVGDSDHDGVFAFKRVSPHIEKMNRVMIHTTDHHAEQEPRGQWKRQRWLAHVIVSHTQQLTAQTDHFHVYDWEYLHTIQDQQEHVCEGVLLTIDVVLTAAGCVDPKTIHGPNGQQVLEVVDMRVHLAFDAMQVDKVSLRAVEAVEYAQDDQGGRYDYHEDFDFHNVALVKLEKHTSMGRGVIGMYRNFLLRSPVLLPRDDDARDYKGCQVTGFDPAQPLEILVHRAKMRPTETCISPLMRPDTVERFHSHHLCAHESTSGAVKQGSPLTCVDDDDRVVVHGIASFDLRMPGNDNRAFTKVSKYRRWIEAQVRGWDVEDQQNSFYRRPGDNAPYDSTDDGSDDSDDESPGSQTPPSTPPSSQPPPSTPTDSQPPSPRSPGSQPPSSRSPGSQPPSSRSPGSQPSPSRPPSSQPPSSRSPGSQPPSPPPGSPVQRPGPRSPDSGHNTEDDFDDSLSSYSGIDFDESDDELPPRSQPPLSRSPDSQPPSSRSPDSEHPVSPPGSPVQRPGPRYPDSGFNPEDESQCSNEDDCQSDDSLSSWSGIDFDESDDELPPRSQPPLSRSPGSQPPPSRSPSFQPSSSRSPGSQNPASPTGSPVQRPGPRSPDSGHNTEDDFEDSLSDLIGIDFDDSEDELPPRS